MPERIPQSVAYSVVFKAFLASDHISAATGKTITITISKNLAAFGTPNAGGTATAIANGWYYLTLNTTDTNTLGPLIFHGEEGTIDNVDLAYNVVKATNAGFTGIPDAVAGASGGLPLSVDASGRVDILKINGTSQTARDIGASVLLSPGTGTGQLDITSGVVKANLVQILATALTETAGYLAAAFKQFFNIASPTSTMNTITGVTTVTNLTNAPTAGDLTATMKTSVTTACTASTPIAASVTGNVGGNVVGSVASVSGAVASVTGNVGGNVTGSVGSLAAQAKADVNAEVVDAFATDTYAEPAQGAPGATISLAAKIGYLFKAWRNKITQTATQYSLYNDDAATIDHKASVSDDATTYTKGEVATGP
jgi:hypothetical protein